MKNTTSFNLTFTSLIAKYSSINDFVFFSISSIGSSFGVTDGGLMSADLSLLRLDSLLWFLDCTGVLLPLALRGPTIFLKRYCCEQLITKALTLVVNA